jgi:hypothetical protein
MAAVLGSIGSRSIARNSSAPKPADDIALAETGLETLRDCLEHLISDDRPLFFVDVMEMIKIDMQADLKRSLFLLATSTY